MWVFTENVFEYLIIASKYYAEEVILASPPFKAVGTLINSWACCVDCWFGVEIGFWGIFYVLFSGALFI